MLTFSVKIYSKDGFTVRNPLQWPALCGNVNLPKCVKSAPRVLLCELRLLGPPRAPGPFPLCVVHADDVFSVSEARLPVLGCRLILRVRIIVCVTSLCTSGLLPSPDCATITFPSPKSQPLDSTQFQGGSGLTSITKDFPFQIPALAQDHTTSRCAALSLFCFLVISFFSWWFVFLGGGEYLGLYILPLL